MIHLIQLVLPLYAEDQQRHPESVHLLVKAELTRRFGALTACTRSRADGRWEEGGRGATDDFMIYEVMPLSLDTEWWSWYRETLESRFQHVQVVIRSLPTF